jgi:hypothetical protein
MATDAPTREELYETVDAHYRQGLGPRRAGGREHLVGFDDPKIEIDIDDEPNGDEEP